MTRRHSATDQRARRVVLPAERRAPPLRCELPRLRHLDLIGGKTYHFGNIYLSVPQILTIVTALLLMIFLTLFVARTKIGKAMRATSFDREAASMMGIDVDRVIASTFFIGSALAGAAGVMFGLVFGQIFHYMGFFAGLKGFMAAVIGGIGSIPGAMLGGLLVGLAESYSTGYLPQGSTFQNLYVFALLILIILIKPSGILGKADVKKSDDGGREPHA